MLTPYWYQQEAIDEAINFLVKEKGNGIIEIGTGGGKTLVQAEIAKRVYNIAPNHQMLFVSDITAIIGSNKDGLLEQWPSAKTSVFSASYGEKSHKGELVFCGIQSVYKKADLFNNVSVVFIDEVHRASLNSNSMYKQFINGLKKTNPHLRILSMTASPWKMSGSLVGTWICDKIIYKIGMSTLFDEGFICPLITPKTKISADLSKVKINSSGDFNEEAMNEVMDDDILVKAAIKESVEKAIGRHSILVFASSVKHAEHIKIALKSHGEHSRIIIGETDTDERREIVKEFNDFRLRWLISIGTITTGFNSRVVDCGVILRATKSSSLWLQIVGRLLRTHESKTDALVLDFGSNISRFGKITEIGPPPSKDEVKQAKRTPFKQCSGCNKLVKYLEKSCPFCFVEFGVEVAPNHGTEASTADIMDTESTIKDVPVDRVTFCKHHSQRSGGKSLRVTYYHGMEGIHLYLFFEGKAFQRAEACEWWNKFAADGMNEVCPKNLDTVLAELKQYGMRRIPKSISVDYAKTQVTSSGNIFGHNILNFN